MNAIVIGGGEGQRTAQRRWCPAQARGPAKFSEAQIAFILRQGEEGTPVGEVCRKAGLSEATYCNWRKKYGGLMPSEMKRLRQLEEENSKLNKIVADLSLDKEMLAGRHPPKVLRPRVHRQVGSLGKILPQEPIGVLIGPTLPRNQPRR